MQSHLAEHYSQSIKDWLWTEELNRPHKPITDEDIWVRIGCKWPTFSQAQKAAIFKYATGRTYECSDQSSSSRASPYYLDSSFSSIKGNRG